MSPRVKNDDHWEKWKKNLSLDSRKKAASLFEYSNELFAMNMHRVGAPSIRVKQTLTLHAVERDLEKNSAKTNAKKHNRVKQTKQKAENSFMLQS